MSSPNLRYILLFKLLRSINDANQPNPNPPKKKPHSGLEYSKTMLQLCHVTSCNWTLMCDKNNKSNVIPHVRFGKGKV